MPFTVAVNQNIIEMEYAVRGPIPRRAAELRKEGRRIIPCHIGNPQAFGQRPITYVRQVLSLLEEPSRIGRERVLKKISDGEHASLATFADDDFISDYVLDVAEEMLTSMEAGVGAYTESKGPLFIREAIAGYIDRRDGIEEAGDVPSNPDNIFLTDGASEAAKYIIELLIADPSDGIMIPIPQYPLYSATLRRCGGVLVGYYPDEDSGWSLDKSMLVESLQKARDSGVNVKAIVVINPANPTGAILDEQSGRDVVEFARENDLAIIADEVYQENLYGSEFISFARLVGNEDVPLFSLHSTSKGYYGECGHRGGYFEVRNPPRAEGTDTGFIDLLLKQASVSLCSNTMGQALMYLIVSPPEEGSEPYAQFAAERDKILGDLYDKAMMVKDAFQEMTGVESFGRIGALYHFPRLNKLPEGTTDFDYCMSLLENTGLCTVNGSGFGQKEGTHHLRIAFLPPKELLEQVLPEWIEFHNRYVG